MLSFSSFFCYKFPICMNEVLSREKPFSKCPIQNRITNEPHKLFLLNKSTNGYKPTDWSDVVRNTERKVKFVQRCAWMNNISTQTYIIFILFLLYIPSNTKTYKYVYVLLRRRTIITQCAENYVDTFLCSYRTESMHYTFSGR